MSAAQKGKKRTPEQRANTSIALKGRKLSPESIEKIRLGNLGKVMSLESRQKMSLARKGRSFSLEHCRRISVALKGKAKSLQHYRSRWTPEANEQQGRMMAEFFQSWPRPRTVLERALYRLLEVAGLDYIPEKRFGRYIVDAYLPTEHIAFEADGVFWHQNKEREQKRDGYLSHFILAVVHLDDNDLAPFVALQR